MYTIVQAQNLMCGKVSEVAVGLLSYLNHACHANATVIDVDVHGTKALVSLRPIACGEEVTPCYVEGIHTEERMQLLHSLFGFVCSCATCSLG